MGRWRSRFVLVLAVAATGCASLRASEPAKVTLADLDVPVAVRDLVCTVYPRPAEAVYRLDLLDANQARRVGPNDGDVFAEALARRGLTQTWDGLPPEGYLLVVDDVDGDPSLLMAARDTRGRRAAFAALRQLGAQHDGRSLVRACRIVDAPGFPLRGSKRLRAWELDYRGNLSWGRAKVGASALEAELVDEVEVVSPGNPLDASDAAVRAVLDRFAAARERGVRRFALAFDDVGFDLTERSRLAFGGYARALRSYLGRVFEGLRKDDARAVLYYLPQTYWWTDARMEPFAGALREAGGLPRELGLVLTGPEVISDTIDTSGLIAARQAFGLTHTRALLYDNRGREGDWGPLTGRDADLVTEADGVFGERGTPVNRLTRLDWSWNPAGYDPEWSWRRAVLELAGPSAYGELLEVCTLFRNRVPEAELMAAIDRFAAAPPGEAREVVPRARLVQLLRDDARLPVGDAPE